MQIFCLPEKIFLTHVPQDSGTSLEAIFIARGRPGRNFTLQNGTIFMHGKVITCKGFFHKKNEMSKKERRVEKESQIR